MASFAPLPEDPVKLGRCETNFNAGDPNVTTDNQPGAEPENELNGNAQLHDASTSSQNSDVNRNVNNTTRNMKAGSARRPASLPPGELTRASGTQRKRGSYHQDVEEALSSLLWQPYEYRTQSDSSDTLSTLSLSTGSSSSTSLSYEYATINKNGCGGGLLHSFTDEFLNVATLYGNGNGNAADPNLRPCSVQSAQMVTNLMVLDAASVGSQAGQCRRLVRSRGRHEAAANSKGNSASSRVRELVRCTRVHEPASASAVNGNSDVEVQVSGGEMRVEIPGQVAVGVVSSDMIPSNITSVVSANVVGLPVHSRSSSTLSTRTDLQVHQLQPNHLRSVSDSTNTNILHTRQDSQPGRVPPSTNILHTRQDSQPGRVPPSTNILHTRQDSQPGRVPASTNILHTRQDSQPGRVPASTNILHTRQDSQPGRVPASTNILHTKQDSQPGRVPASTNILHTRQDSQPGRVPPLPNIPNVSNVNVNFYRAVPVNVVSNVPTIQCVNSVEDVGNNVSNVHIVQAMPAPTVAVPTHHQVHIQQSQPPTIPSTTVTEVRTRTFTSTEAQTDDTTVGTIINPTVVPNINREQRRRERRERRHQRRVNSHPHQLQQQHQPHVQSQSVQNVQNVQSQWPSQCQPNDRLPDLLNSHLPPPYSTLPGGMPPPMAMVAPPPPPPMFPPGVVPVVQAAPPPVPVPGPVTVPQPPSGFRFPFPNANGFRRCRTRLGPRYSTEEHQPKSCCGFLVSRPGSLRWFIALIALVAVCCVLVGTVLGAMRPAGRDHLTVSLLMIGVGIVLVTVSGVAWRLTSHDAPSCRAMLGLETGDSGDVCTRRFVPRLPPSYGRPHHPYAAMIYPEFQYRPPPPSYQASMQEYRLRLLLLDRAGSQQQPAQHAVSPPPTYRSHAGSLLRAPLSNRRDATQSEYSCPPSYRSRSSSNRQPSVGPVAHSREQSLTLSESNPDGSVVNVVSILANQEDIALENMTLDSLKVAPENEIPPLRMLLKSSSGSDLDAKDGNLVTIVQKADQNPVIVTVSGSQMSTTNPEVGSSNQIPSEMEILAHL